MSFIIVRIGEKGAGGSRKVSQGGFEFMLSITSDFASSSCDVRVGGGMGPYKFLYSANLSSNKTE